MKSRIHFLDHIRTFAIFLVVVLHSGLVYELVLDNIWIVSDPDKNNSIGLIRMYLDQFVMYTIFFVSGFLIPYSVQNKSTRAFLISKVKRILLPWFLAVFTLIPLYKMVFLYSRNMPQEAWYSYFHIFQRSGSDLGLFSNNPSQNWLWFLPILFTFQVLYLGLTKIKAFPIGLSVKSGIILTIVLGVTYSMVISSAGLTGWHHSGFWEFQRERLIPYLLVFLFGVICNHHRVFDQAENNKRLYIAANLVMTVALGVFTVVALNMFFNLIEPGRNYFFVSSFVDRTVYYLTSLLSMFSILYVMIYVSKRYFNKTNPLMNTLNRNSYSVYIIHVIVLGVLAVPMMQLPIPSFVKFLLLTVLTFVVSNILVSAYNQLFQKRIALKIAALAFSVIAFFSVISFGNDQESSFEIAQQEVPPPAIGIHEAAIQGNVVAIRQHLQAGTNLNMKEQSGGSTPLITAAVFGKTEIVQTLVEAGADVNQTNNEGSTALVTAAFFGRTKIVELLLTHGADHTIRNQGGSTALESVSAPFEEVKGVYDYFNQSLGPLGLKLDYEELKQQRPEITEILRKVNG